MYVWPWAWETRTLHRILIAYLYMVEECKRKVFGLLFGGYSYKVVGAYLQELCVLS